MFQSKSAPAGPAVRHADLHSDHGQAAAERVAQSPKKEMRWGWPTVIMIDETGQLNP
jgi:hypothetical protein